MTDNSFINLTTSAQRLVEAAVQKQTGSNHARLCVKHWLLALLERHAAMAEAMVAGLNAEETRKKLLVELENQDLGTPLDQGRVAARAFELAKERSRLQAAERDVAVVIFRPPRVTTSLGLPRLPPARAGPGSGQFIGNPTGKNKNARPGAVWPQLDRRRPRWKIVPDPGPRRRNPVDRRNPLPPHQAQPGAHRPGWRGQNRRGGRPGQPHRLGKVPAMLRGMDIIALQPSTLVAGADTRGELEKRIQAILKEASANNILLFIDEIHTIMGAGGMTGTTDMGAQLKPTLARGDIAGIAATTDDEYRKFIETDTALERRFQPIRINELSEEQTLNVLVSLSRELSRRYQITIEEGVLAWLIQFGSQYMRNRHFPDKAVDLLEQSVAHTVAHDGRQLTLENARNVAQRMVGMPLSLEERFKNLEKKVKDQGVMNKDELQALLEPPAGHHARPGYPLHPPQRCPAPQQPGCRSL